MSTIEETIDATLDPSGQLWLSHQPRLLPGPVRVTICAAATIGPRRSLADVIREIAAEQRSPTSPDGRQETCAAEDAVRSDEDTERDRELDAARCAASQGGP